MQHSLWTAEVINSNLEAGDSVLSDVLLSKKVFFRRIWQGKGAQAAASEVTHSLHWCLLTFVDLKFYYQSVYVIHFHIYLSQDTSFV